MVQRICGKCGVNPARGARGAPRCDGCLADKNAADAVRRRYERSREGLPRVGDCSVVACKDCGVVFQFIYTGGAQRTTCSKCAAINARNASANWGKKHRRRGPADHAVNVARRLRRHGLPPDTVPPTACEVCGDETELHIDHDHACCPGKWSCGSCVTGWLCNNCNNGLGRFRDDPDLLRAAAAYVARTRRRLRAV